MTDEATTTDATVDAAAATTTDAPVTTTSPNLTGPWAEQLRSSFTDPDLQVQVDAFLRSTVQPYVTKLEQSTNDLKDAQRLYDDLNTSPGETFLAITEELFGPDAVDKVTAALKSGDAEVTPDGDVVATAPAALDDESKALLAHVKEQKQLDEYNAAIGKFVADGHDDVTPKWFHPFVAAAEGDLDVAYTGYSEWLADIKAEGAVTDETVTETPPNALGSDTGGTTTPPLQPAKQTMDEALDDFFDSLKSSAPPPVGSI